MSDKKSSVVLLDRLQETLLKIGNTNEEIAKALSCDHSTINKWYNGKLTPSFDKIVSICQKANVSIDYICGFRESPTNNAKISDICEYTGLNEDAIEKIKKSGYKNILYSDIFAAQYIDLVVDDLYQLYEHYELQVQQDQYDYAYIDNSPILSAYKAKYLDILNDFISSECLFTILDRVMSIFINYKNYKDILEIGKGNFDLFENCNSDEEVERLLEILGLLDLSDYEKIQKLNIYECQEEITKFCKKYIDMDNYPLGAREDDFFIVCKTKEIMDKLQFNSKEEYLAELKKLYNNSTLRKIQGDEDEKKT